MDKKIHLKTGPYNVLRYNALITFAKQFSMCPFVRWIFHVLIHFCVDVVICVTSYSPCGWTPIALLWTPRSIWILTSIYFTLQAAVEAFSVTGVNMTEALKTITKASDETELYRITKVKGQTHQENICKGKKQIFINI